MAVHEEGEEWADGDWDGQAWEQPAAEPAAEPAAKRPRKALPRQRPEDLEPGATVLYQGGWRGVIRDAFLPLDEFWVADEESGELLRNSKGDIIQFKSSELTLVAPPPVATKVSGDAEAPAGGVVVIGGEEHMMKILDHFGVPDTETRQNPQQLLAIPCHMCDPANLLAVATEGVGEEVLSLGRRLREDLHVGVRAFHLKQAVEALGPDLLRLEKHYCLAAVQLPFGWEEIELEDIGPDEKHRRREVCNQVDLGATAVGAYDDEVTSDAAARRALGTTCGVEVSDTLWDEKVQLRLRKLLGVSIATKFVDANGTDVTAIIIPEDASITTVRGVLCFSEARDADYTRSSSEAAAIAAGKGKGKLRLKPGVAAGLAGKGAEAASAAGAALSEVKEEKIQGKTVAEWEEEQQQFANEPKLPPGWLRICSRSSGEVYFFHRQTGQATFTFPEPALPEGWTKQVSKSTGKTYYFNAARKISTFERPTE